MTTPSTRPSPRLPLLPRDLGLAAIPSLAALAALTLIVVAAFGVAYQWSFLGAYGVGFATFHLDIANLASWGLTPALLFAPV